MNPTPAYTAANDPIDMIENVTFDELRIGQSADLVRTLTQADVQAFAAVSGDSNPAHLDPVYAADTVLHTIVGHGMWTGALISALFGTVLPGLGTIYLEQNLRFRHPVRIGDTLVVRVTVRAKDERRKHVEFDCEVTNQKGETIVTGSARVLAPTVKLRRPRTRLPTIKLVQEPAAAAA
ncbi:MAG: MaoC family dehydratase N-terminal domain-containing protein [Burkholderiaceae bacterium]|jgi:phosphate acetyltransferase|nr:MaoC family dehydratase N-terminal domain-containing protein [Burkholderiaceae bacterium]